MIPIKITITTDLRQSPDNSHGDSLMKFIDPKIVTSFNSDFLVNYTEIYSTDSLQKRTNDDLTTLAP